MRVLSLYEPGFIVRELDKLNILRQIFYNSANLLFLIIFWRSAGA